MSDRPRELVEYSIAGRSAIVWSFSFVSLVAAIFLLFHRSPYSFGLIVSENAVLLGCLIIGALISFIRAIGYLAKAIWCRYWLHRSPTKERYLRFGLVFVVAIVSAIVFLIEGSVGLSSGEITFAFLRGAGSVSMRSSPVAYWASVGAFFFFGSILVVAVVAVVVGCRNFLRQVDGTSQQ